LLCAVLLYCCTAVRCALYCCTAVRCTAEPHVRTNRKKPEY
jgi:hypothetical protein